eukprot:1302261-Amphidinium_carterae.1
MSQSRQPCPGNKFRIMASRPDKVISAVQPENRGNSTHVPPTSPRSAEDAIAHKPPQLTSRLTPWSQKPIEFARQ